MTNDTHPEPMTIEEWDETFRDLADLYDFRALAIDWHSGQWSGFYRLQCTGRILDDAHAVDVWSEARRNVEQMDPHHDDREAMTALRDIADAFPPDDDDPDHESEAN